MNALFVNACVKEDSRTRFLCEAYIQIHWENKEYVLKELDLCKEPLLPLNRERLAQKESDTAAGNFLSADYGYAREFAGADEILIGALCWDSSYPALLKIYLEQVCVKGITFQHGAGRRPVKICAGKKLVIITVCGGYLCENNSFELYFKELSALMGIPEICIFKAEGLEVPGNDPQEVLQRTVEDLFCHG